MPEASSGMELLALPISPTFDYLYSVSDWQTGILLGCPAAMLLMSIIVVTKYRRRRAAGLYIGGILVMSVLVILGTRDVTASGEGAYFGLLITMVVSSVLLLHQLLLKLSRRTYGKYRWLPVITGQGFYRWRDS